MERINVRVDRRLKQQLEAEARARGVSPSEIVRQVLGAHLERLEPRETAYDLAKRLGILGVYKNAPPDLSTNPEHMEGFGRD
jgi:hypothetical protein